MTERIPESCSIGVLLLAVILPLAFSACSSDTDEAVFFTGSSLVEKWDVRRFFPTKVTYNAGLSGAGIDYVESQGKQFKGENVVLIIGGNDVVSVDDTEAYVERYLRMLQNMEAKRIYLYSILPRLAFESDGYEKVRLLNKKIREGVTERLDNVVYIDVFDLFLEGGRLNCYEKKRNDQGGSIGGCVGGCLVPVRPSGSGSARQPICAHRLHMERAMERHART